MDELYFEEGYLELRYFAVIANASSGSRYLLEGYLPEDYFEYRGSFASVTCAFDVVIIGTTKEFEIAVQSQFDTATAGVKTVSGNALFNSEFTQTAFGQRAQDTDLFAFSDAAIQAQVDRIRDNNIEATAVFSVSSEVSRIRALDTDAFGGFSFVGNVQRSRATEMETQAAFSFAVSEDLFKDFGANLSDEFTQSVQEDLFKAFDSDISSESTQTADAQRLRDNEITLETTAALTAEFRVVRDAHLTGTGVAAIVCDAGKTVDESSTLSNSITLTSLSGKLQSVQSQQSFRFVILAVTDRRDNILYFNANSLVSFTSQGAVIPQNGEIISTTNSSEEWISLPYFGQVYTGSPIGASTSNYSITLKVTLANSTHDPGIIVKAGQNTSSGQHWWNIRIQHFNSTTKRIYLSSNESDSGSRVWDVNNVDWTQPTTIRFSATYASNYISGLRRVILTVNNVQVGSSIRHDGNSGDWDTQQDPRISFVNTSSSPIVIEDFRFSKNALPASAYSDGLERQIDLAFDTRQLLNFDNLDREFYIDHIGEAAVTSQSTLTASLTANYDLTLDLPVQSSVNADVNKIGEINLTAFSDGALTAEILKIHPGDAVIESQSSLLSTVVANREYDSDVDSEFTVQSDIKRFRDNDSQLASEYTQLTLAEKITDTGSTIESTTALTALGGRLEEINLVAFSDGRIEVSVRKFTGYSSNITSEATVDAVIGNKKPLAGDLQAEASTATVVDRLRDYEADVTAEMSVTAEADRLRQGVISITAQSKTVNTYIEEEHGLYIDDGYFTEFEIIAQKITDITQDLGVECEISAEIGGSFFAELVANTNADITASAVKQVSALVDKAVEFAVTAVASPIRDFSSNISAEFAVFANGVTGGEINAVLFNAATVSATAEATKPFDSSLLSEFTQNTETFDSLNGSLESYQSAEFSQSSDVNVIRDAVIVTESIATSLSVAVKETAADIVCETRFDIIIDGAKVTDTTSNNDAAFAISNTAVKTAAGVVDIVAEATVSADATVVISAQISTESIASQLTAVVKVAAFFVNADVVSAVSADVNVTRNAVSENEIITDILVDGGAVRNADSDVDVVASVTALVGVVKPFEATIASAMAFVAGVREIRTDDVVYVIPAEGWTYTIAGEGREHDIIGETRVRKITAESRLRRIKGESRIYNIE